MNKILIIVAINYCFSLAAEEIVTSKDDKPAGVGLIPNVQIEANIKQGVTSSSDARGIYNVTNFDAKVAKKAEEVAQVGVTFSGGQNDGFSAKVNLKILADGRLYFVNKDVVKFSVGIGMGGGKDAILGPSFIASLAPIILDICTKEKELWTLCSVTKLRGDSIYGDSGGVLLSAGTALIGSKKVNDSIRVSTGVEYKYEGMLQGNDMRVSGHQVTFGLGVRFDIASGTNKK